jgi:hypothetical protein
MGIPVISFQSSMFSLKVRRTIDEDAPQVNGVKLNREGTTLAPTASAGEAVK